MSPPTVDDFCLLFCVDGAFDWCTDEDIKKWIDHVATKCAARVPAMYLAAHLLTIEREWERHKRPHWEELIKRILAFDEIPDPPETFYKTTRYGRAFWNILQRESKTDA